MIRYSLALAIGVILPVCASQVEAQVPPDLTPREQISFSGMTSFRPARRPPPSPFVDPTSRDGASVRSRNRPMFYFQSPGLPYGMVPTSTLVPTILPVMGRPPVIYSRAYSGSGPIQYGGTYNLYGGYATANVPEGPPTVLVISPPSGVRIMPGR